MLLMYTVSDIILIIITICGMKRVKARKNELMTTMWFKSRKEETQERLKEILYLPIEYESDVASDEDEV